MSNNAPIVLLRLPQVCERVNLSRTPVLNAIDRGEFPQPIKIAPRAVAWIESEINDWIQQRIAQRVPGVPATKNKSTK